MRNSGVVSVILVNFRGTDDTLEAISNLGMLDWPENLLEIVVVENGSGDDSAERLRREAPGVVLVESSTNDGFAGGCNRGVEASTGEFVAFLNNDARPDAQWVRAAVNRFSESPRIGAVASRVLDWNGELVDYIGSAMTWYGMGYKPETAEKLPKVEPGARDVLFGTGSAMFVRRAVYDTLGGFDESYFMFFEDVDFGWRLNLRGWRFAYEPLSLAFHKHHASMAGIGDYREQYLLERNALFTLYKNLSKENLAEALPAAMALSVRRAVARSVADSTSLDIRRSSTGEDATEIVHRDLLAATYAIDQFTENLPILGRSREQVQSNRVVNDTTIWQLFGLVDAPVFNNEYYLRGYENLVTEFDVTEAPLATRVLIITGDPIGAKLAGPAIRAWNIAEALAKNHSVRLLTMSTLQQTAAPFELVRVSAGDERGMAPHEQWADVIVFQGHAMAAFGVISQTKKIVVVDIYDPMHLEQLEQSRELDPEQWARQVSDATEVLNQQLSRGDFFICASERQRHFFLGQLAGLGRLNPLTYEGDPDLRGLIDVVPFGLSAIPPVHERAVVKGVLPGIAADDKLVLWSGGLYNWFDPHTLIRAIEDLSQRRDGIRLFFQGTKHPHPGVPEMAVVATSRALALDLGILDRSVFFNSSWIDYADRQNYLTEADAGVSTHHAHIETTFSFRTRILDYLWANLPMVVTEGDHFAEVVEREGLGIVVADGDVAALSLALERVLFDEEFIAAARANIARVREQYLWQTALEPLTRFMASPHAAFDRPLAEVGTERPRSRERVLARGARHDAALVVHYLKNGGPLVLVKKITGRLSKNST